MLVPGSSGDGWNAEQMAHHGTVFKTRFQKLGELRERAAKAGRTRRSPTPSSALLLTTSSSTRIEPLASPGPFWARRNLQAVTWCCLY